MNSLFSLKDEVAVVIGAGGVLAGAIAEGFAQAGAKIAVLDLREEQGAARVKSIEAKGGLAKFFQVNAMERESLKNARLGVEAAFGPATILLNAAGGNDPRTTVTPENPFESIQFDLWKRNFDLNLAAGALLPCQEFGPSMVANKKGSIINIASVSAHIPLSRVVAYSAAKAAVLSLTQFLAREWAPFNVRVNSITPGFFPADQNRALLFNPDGTPTARTEAVWGHTPMKRFGEANELVGAAVFLASAQAASFVTGSDIRVDGGYLCQTI
jgi:NAD(P)-dependent dehydrogenase (short-subunit alcohol dehydrogenase family)